MALNTTLNAETVEAEAETDSIYTIKQGDAINIPVVVTVDGTAVTDEDVVLFDTIEFMIGHCVRKVCKAADVWSDEAEAFLFPLDQTDTLRMRPGIYEFDCRIKFANGEVLGKHNTERIKIADSMSWEVIP